MKINLILKYSFSSNFIFESPDNIIPNEVFVIDAERMNSEPVISYYDRETLLTLTKMAENAYTYPNASDWTPFPINKTTEINPEKDTLRGFIFSDYDEKNLIIVLKGTSLGLLSNGSYNDKFNDNLFFSCNIKNNKRYACDLDSSINCYKQSLEFPLNYINIANKYFDNLIKKLDLKNPDKNVLMVGHSLGGTLATYIGVKYDFRVVTFGSPGEYNYFKESGLIEKYTLRNKHTPTHYRLSSDPIAKGECNGLLSWCYIFGYNIQTKCHYGNVCEYVVPSKYNILEHRIVNFIKYLKIYEHPICIIEKNCLEDKCTVHKFLIQ